MSTSDLELPLIDLDRYINPKSPEDRKAVVAELHEACEKFGFFQVKGHGVPLEVQRRFLTSLNNLFNLPREEKLELSFLKSSHRRGYEAIGDSHRKGDATHDCKEAFYIGRDEPEIDASGLHGPNVWPNLPEDQFRGPVWDYYQRTSDLGKTIWEILLQALGYSADVMANFAKKPIVPMKMIRYPGSSKVAPGQFGVGPHNDFGGVTVLLQQPDRHGLEVYYPKTDEWLSVPAVEDVYVINCGDMIQRWSGGVYKSARHRVINKTDDERLSCATFWHGDVHATNPLNPNDPNRDTVGELLLKRFGYQYKMTTEQYKVAAN